MDNSTPAPSRRSLLTCAGLGTLGLFAAVGRGTPARAGGRAPVPVAGEPVYTLPASAEGCVAATFDDGPHPVYTPQVLDALRYHGVRAVFCVVGQEVQRYPDLLRTMLDDGHDVASHTWSHANLQNLTRAQVDEELERAAAAIDAAVPGHTVTWFRAPYGRWSTDVFESCAALGMRPLGWSVDPRDWERPGTDAIADRIIAQTRSRSIILCHDAGGDRSQTVEALETWVPWLMDADYRFTRPM